MYPKFILLRARYDGLWYDGVIHGVSVYSVDLHNIKNYSSNNIYSFEYLSERINYFIEVGTPFDIKITSGEQVSYAMCHSIHITDGNTNFNPFKIPITLCINKNQFKIHTYE